MDVHLRLELPGIRVLDCRGVWEYGNVLFAWVSKGFRKQEAKKSSKNTTSVFTELGALVLNEIVLQPKTWTLLTAFLVPHPCAVCCTTRRKRGKWQCFGHRRGWHGRL